MGISHSYAHRWEYCSAISNSSVFDTFLYVAMEGDEKAICPLSVREREDGCPELVSPYGFGGLVSTISVENSIGFRTEWIRFCEENGFVTAYIMQHPAFPLSPSVWGEDLFENHILYLIDLTSPVDEIWQQMGKTHRYEVRRCEGDSSIELMTDRRKLKEAMLSLYPQTMRRVGASEVYHFSSETLEKLVEAPDSLLLGVEDGSGVQVVTLFFYTPCAADYFISASLPEGRKYTRLLVWTAIKMLKRLNTACLNLAGGVKPGDTLDQFKRRFGGRMVRGQVLKQVFDKEKYAYLCRKYCPTNHPETGYFPPYWETN